MFLQRKKEIQYSAVQGPWSTDRMCAKHLQTLDGDVLFSYCLVFCPYGSDSNRGKPHSHMCATRVACITAISLNKQEESGTGKMFKSSSAWQRYLFCSLMPLRIGFIRRRFEWKASSIKFNNFSGVTSEYTHCLFMWKWVRPGCSSWFSLLFFVGSWGSYGSSKWLLKWHLLTFRGVYLSAFFSSPLYMQSILFVFFIATLFFLSMPWKW